MNQVGTAEPSKYAQYLYSGGQRVKKLVRSSGGSTETTVYIDGVFEHRYDGTNSQSLTHVGGGITVRAGYAFDGIIGVSYSLSNHLGSVSLRLDQSGGDIDHEEYYPFGDSSVRTWSDTKKKRYRYVGKEKDAESGLYYYGARYYAAWTCRFISVDPLVAEYPQLSSYNYADNNPINDLDIDGMQNIKSDRHSDLNTVPDSTASGSDNTSAYIPKPEYKISENEPNIVKPNVTTIWLEKGQNPEVPEVTDDVRGGDIFIYWYHPGHEEFDPSNDNPTQVAEKYIYHCGNDFADEGWLTEEQHTQANLDWHNGQVLPPMKWYEKLPVYTEGAREWHGYGVDSKGYLTGKPPAGDLSVLVGGGSAKTKAVKTIAGANKIILMGKKPGTWVIYRGIKEMSNGKFGLYIGKAKHGVKYRYKSNDLRDYKVQTLRLLRGIPDNGTALGVEQTIMELNGWVDKASNKVKPVLSNVNHATVKQIYKEQGLKWLNANVSNWQELYKFQ